MGLEVAVELESGGRCQSNQKVRSSLRCAGMETKGDGTSRWTVRFLCKEARSGHHLGKTEGGWTGAE